MKTGIRNIAMLALAMVLATTVRASSPPNTSLVSTLVAPNLGSARYFAVLAASTVTSAGVSAISGDLGLSPGTSVTGFPPGMIAGMENIADPTSAQAQLDLTAAYNDAAGRTLGAIGLAGNLGGRTLAPGLYKSTSSLEISSGDLTLDAQGDPNAVYIFQMASTLVTTVGRKVILAGGAQAGNIYWQVGSSATLGVNSVFKGNIMAMASITAATSAAVEGRLLARTAAVTLDNNTVYVGNPLASAVVPTAPTASNVLAATAEAMIPLGSFEILAASTITNTGATHVTGNLGLSPGTAVTGFPPGIMVGTKHLADAAAAQGQLALTVAYNAAAARSVGAIGVAGNLGGMTLAPGLYKSTSSLAISSGDLTLDAKGDGTAVFIFQMGSTLVTTVGRKVILAGGARAENIIWQVGSSATLGVNSVFKGNILAMASITVTTGASVEGRLLARTGAVTLDSNAITMPPAAAPQAILVDPTGK